jgi:ribosomal protein S18 acetylase RimI-like enzyme
MKTAERALFYLKSEGILSSIKRALVLLRRTFIDNKMCLFAVDLSETTSEIPEIALGVKIERMMRIAQISEDDMPRLLGNFGRSARKMQINERLKRGANLWLAKCNGKLAGYGWSIQATTIEPYYFPLTDQDVHLFDYHVFPEFRGNGINVYLVEFMLSSLKKERVKRAFIETRIWNTAERRSLQKTSFHQMGICRKLVLFGNPIVVWYLPPKG